MNYQELLDHQPSSLKEIEEWIEEMTSTKIEPYYLDVPYDPRTESKPRTGELLIKGADKVGQDYHYAMDQWTQWLLDIFDVSHIVEQKFNQNLEEKAKENPDWYLAFRRWVHETNSGKSIDFFGEIYESEFLSSHKAQRNGQFFTPQCIAKLCSEVVGGNKDLPTYTVNDCACGSGRMLLGAYEVFKDDIDNDRKFHFFVGGDIDNSSVRMCALNLMIHGLQGLVINQDALRLNKPKYGYLINPTNAPVKTGLHSVQYLNSDECANFCDWQDEKTGVHKNMGKVIDFYHWQWKVAHRCKEQDKITPIKVEGQQYVIDFDNE